MSLYFLFYFFKHISPIINLSISAMFIAFGYFFQEVQLLFSPQGRKTWFYNLQLKCCGWKHAFINPNGNSAKYTSSCTCAGNADGCVQYKYSRTCSTLYLSYVSNALLAAGWFCTISVIFPIICAVTTAKMASQIKGLMIMLIDWMIYSNIYVSILEYQRFAN